MTGTVNLGEVNQPSGVRRLDAIFDGFKTYQVLKAALRMGLFDWLAAHGASTREEIVTGTGMHGMYSRSFLSVLVEEGLLVSQSSRYTNSQVTDAFLVRGPFYQGDLLGLDTKWQAFPDVLAGKVDIGDVAVPVKTSFAARKQGFMRGELQGIVQAIAKWNGFDGVRTLCDAGGTNGLLAVALCQINPRLGATVYEQPSTVESTRETVHEHGMTERIKVGAGSIREIEGCYDILLVCHQLYGFRRDLGYTFKRLHDHLNRGGLLVTDHWFCGPGCGATEGIHELDKALSSLGHPLCHLEKVLDTMGQAGFKLIQNSELPSVYGVSNLFLALTGGCCDLPVKENCCQNGG